MNALLRRGRRITPSPNRNIHAPPRPGEEDSSSSSSTFLYLDALLKAKNQSSRSLRRTHAFVAVGGLLQNPHLGARLIVRNSDLGDLRSAQSLFHEIGGSCSFLWNSMTRASAMAGDFAGTLELYSSMRRANIPANNYTYPFVLKACSSSMRASSGRCVHGEMLKTGFSFNPHAQAALLSMYAKGGELADARKVFEEMPDRDLVSWTAMITACEQASEAEESLLLFRRMQKDHGLVADCVTAISVASAIAQLGDSSAARSLHGQAIRHGFFDRNLSLRNAILSMHGKCGELEIARKTFDEMPDRDNISWNSMLSGYAQNGQGSEAMAFFAEMLADGPAPNFVTFLAAASACSQLGSLLLARHLHRLIIFSGDSESRDELQNEVMDMYAKCGDLATATGIFHRRLTAGNCRDVNCFNVIISGYGLHGQGREALQLFRQMTEEEDLSPDHVTFTILLSACSHAGMVDEGKRIFMEMEEKYQMRPMAKHYAGLVDMLGRAGRLEEAVKLITGMAAPPTDAIWGALLGGCRIHGNKEMAELAAGEVFSLDPEHGGYYVLLSNIYAASTKWPEARKVREAMKHKRVRKAAAFSVVEIGGQKWRFYVGDQSHPERAEIYQKAAALVVETATPWPTVS